VVPEILKAEALHDIYESILSGHLGVDKSLGKLKDFIGQDTIMMWCSTCVLGSQDGQKEKKPTPAYYCGVSFAVSGSGYIGVTAGDKLW